MIPPFTTTGVLPAGVHRATIDEIAERFGSTSELRKVQMDSVRWMIDLAIRAGVRRIVLNGSFVTDIMEPNDVDCVLLAGSAIADDALEDEFVKGLPFLELTLVQQENFDELVSFTFSSDRYGNSKGMIEVVGWN